MSNYVEANYVLKTCGFPPTGMQFKAGMNQDTVCGDPTGQTDCATECSEEIPPLSGSRVTMMTSAPVVRVGLARVSRPCRSRRAGMPTSPIVARLPERRG